MPDFDMNSFMTAAYTEANSTEMVPIDEGEYRAISGELEWSEVTSSKDPSKKWPKLRVPWTIESPEQSAKTGRAAIRINQDILLDRTPEGMLDMGEGKNIALGRLRNALGLNQKGVPFRFDQIPGRQALVKVKHRSYEGRIFEEIKDVAKA